jgi:6-phosphofructokinase 1
MSVGADTAVNTIVEACDRISDTARAHRRAFVVEVMGRRCGFLAMRAGIASEAEAIVHGEALLDDEALVAKLRAVLQKAFAKGSHKRRVLIVKAEGVSLPCVELTRRLREHLDEDAPGVDIRETVLGHVVRGGNPSALDRTIAQRLGYGAVIALEQQAHDVMLAWEVPFGHGVETADPSVRVVPLSAVLAETERLLDGTSPVVVRHPGLQPPRVGGAMATRRCCVGAAPAGIYTTCSAEEVQYILAPRRGAGGAARETPRSGPRCKGARPLPALRAWC